MQLSKANPHIEDMNRVRVGETIEFPAITGKGRFSG